VINLLSNIDIVFYFCVDLLKRYCSAFCYKSSKYLEQQISSVPIWLRHTMEFLEDPIQKKIHVWPSKLEKRELEDEYDRKFNPKTEKEAKIIQTRKSNIENENNDEINKSLLFSTQLEAKLQKIEQIKQKSETIEISEPNNISQVGIVLDENREEGKRLDENDENEWKAKLAKVRLDLSKSLDIHKRPSELYYLKRVLKFLPEPANRDKETQPPSNVIFLDLERDTLARYNILFVEYITQRFLELLTVRTAAYLRSKEPNEFTELQQQREKDEYLRKCNDLVSKQSLLFEGLTNESEASPTSHCQSIKTISNLDENSDYTELEMKAKIDALMSTTDPSETQATSSNQNQEYLQASKPVPDLRQLREEAKRQELIVKEYFFSSGIRKRSDKLKKDQTDEDREENVEEEIADKLKQTLVIKSNDETNEEIVRILPMVDAHSQEEIRRSFFYDNLARK
jgi:hypothetical protein